MAAAAAAAANAPWCCALGQVLPAAPAATRGDSVLSEPSAKASVVRAALLLLLLLLAPLPEPYALGETSGDSAERPPPLALAALLALLLKPLSPDVSSRSSSVGTGEEGPTAPGGALLPPPPPPAPPPPPPPLPPPAPLPAVGTVTLLTPLASCQKYTPPLLPLLRAAHPAGTLATLSPGAGHSHEVRPLLVLTKKMRLTSAL